jgi:hypothetical protein
LITRIYRKLKKFNTSKINEPIKKWAMNQTELFQRKKTHVKMCTTSGHKGNANQSHTKIPPHSC